MDTTIIKGQKLPSFDGKKDKFTQWSFTFLSLCALAECKEVLIDGNYDVPADNKVNPTQDEEKKKSK